MPFFAMQYQIHFDDTMAYGTHHHMTNLKFQNAARETLFFETKVDGKKDWQEQFKDIVMLTRETYSLNLAPVKLGEKVAILLTFEDPTRSTVRLCFRTIRQDGQPVSCGYQTLILMHKETLELLPAPKMIIDYANPQSKSSIVEELTEPSFLEVIRSGATGVKKIFSEEIISLGKYVANAPIDKAYPKIIDAQYNEFSLGGDINVSLPKKGTVFLFPGQGSYHHQILRELYTGFPQTAPFFHLANDTALRFLEHEFLPLVTASSEEEHNNLLKVCPPLNQIGIYLTNVLVAKLLMQRGLEPALLLGHSFGELSALAVGGVYSIETGMKIVCQRILALQSLEGAGKMVAVSCPAERAQEIIDELAVNAEVSVINHRRQTVLSGALADLERLKDVLNRQGISMTLLKSQHPFHSSLMQGAVRPFKTTLNSYFFHPSITPVFLCTEGIFYSSDCDLAEVLSSQLIRRLDFKEIVNRLYQRGFRSFIECGAGDIVSNIVLKNLKDTPEVISRPTAPLGKGLVRGLEDVLDFFSKKDVAGPSTKGRARWQQDQHFMSPQADNIAALARNISAFVERDASLPGKSSVLRQNAVSASSSTSGDVPSFGDKLSETGKKRTDSGEDKDRREVTVLEEYGQQKPKVFIPGKNQEMPIAVVSFGCVFPGAKDPEEFWENIKRGVTGIVDLADMDPQMGRDFMSGNGCGSMNVVPDKTYSLLNGTIVDIPYRKKLLAPFYSEAEFSVLTRGEKILAQAAAQSLSGVKSHIDFKRVDRIQCILGATADGSHEYDEALFLDYLQAVVETLDEREDLKEAFSQTLEDLLGYKKGDSRELAQHKIYANVIQRIFHSGIKTYIVDTACSSSLYSVDLGVRSLRSQESDLVLAGGAFAPGPANNTLFSQFQGLSPTTCRPLDASADGAVFGEGASIIILKRLPDALADGDRIWAVIRGFGLSSDGLSPSINVPRLKGQVLAIQRAYETSYIDINTIQYIEAHATGTTVGDAVEIEALKETFRERPRHLPPVELGAVKALIGHTGWVSGAAAIIKVCMAFNERLVPTQHNFTSPNEALDKDNAPFVLSLTSHTWPENANGCPRRAGINGFGFGGTNAHVILEEFHEVYHKSLCDHLPVDMPSKPSAMAVVGMGSLFPSEDELESAAPTSNLRFNRKALRLPEKKMLLPDVTDHMDASQYLSVLAAEKVFLMMGDRWQGFQERMGVVLGMEWKTERGVRANARIFLDRLKRIFTDGSRRHRMFQGDIDRILLKLVDTVEKEIPPSGPYTLPGLMPNITASRISSLFDLNGPNLLIDMGKNSLFQSLSVVEQLLNQKVCEVVLAGGINAYGGKDGTDGEAVVLMALTTPETAEEKNLPVLCQLTISELDGREKTIRDLSRIRTTLDYKGAQGAPEMTRAMNYVQKTGSSAYVKEEQTDGLPLKGVFFDPPRVSEKPSSQGHMANQELPAAYAFVQGTPIHHYTPSLFPADSTGSEVSLEDKHIMFICDQPERWLRLEERGVLNAMRYTLVCPSGTHLKNCLQIDLTSEESVRGSAHVLEQVSYDAIIAVRDLMGRDETSFLQKTSEDDQMFLELLFVLCRRDYERIRKEALPVVALCLHAFNGKHLDPFTGLVSGFMKSLSRELPGSLCKVVNTDEEHFFKGLRQVEMELSQEGPVEVCYRNGRRHAFKLTPITDVSKKSSWLSPDAVVLATGGGRGVTAVLAEELLKRFSCNVIALGRTDPSSTPSKFLEMDEQGLSDYESQFYEEALKKDSTRKITDLRKEFLAHQGANEVSQAIQRMRDLPGKFVYMGVDINDEKAMYKLVEAVYREYGRLDLVLHGAGIQVSKTLAKRAVAEFRHVVSTKLKGLKNIYGACETFRKGRPIHFHVLTSAFSYMGNDGQPDYGAANEALNRVAESMDGSQENIRWSTIAWLGWAGIGMTRGSEFAALAASRRLRGISREEGQKIFFSIMGGLPSFPVNVLLADGEAKYYDVAISSSGAVGEKGSVKGIKREKRAHTGVWELSLENAPFLLDHRINGTPTVPAAFLTSMAANGALQLRPDLKIVSFDETTYRKFVRVYHGREVQLRVNAEIAAEDGEETIIRVFIESDFIHKSGLILQENIRHCETLVRMSAESIQPPEQNALRPSGGQVLPDPYILEVEGSPVSLKGQFNSISNIEVGESYRMAEYKLATSEYPASRYLHLMPQVILIDSLLRFGVIHRDQDGTFPVGVPMECDSLKVNFDFGNPNLEKLLEKMVFRGVNPRMEAGVIRVGPVEARDLDGNILLAAEGGTCQKFGEVELTDQGLGFLPKGSSFQGAREQGHFRM